MSEQEKPNEAPEQSDPSPETPAHKGPETSRRRSRPRDPALARAFRSGRPVTGKVVGVIKGGYEVRAGRSRAFCPHSQIDLQRVEQPEEMIGQELTFKVTQFRRGGEDIVVSRRALLEEDKADEAKALRAALLEGSVVQGKVAGVADFGAFVDLGAGVMGLVHISELSHSRVDRVEDAVKVGDLLSVKILKLHRQGKISLSARQAEADPWSEAEKAFAPGTVCRGKVLRLADFGAFVELRPGIEALAPAREFPPSAEGWNHGIEPGLESNWLVLSISPKQRRVSLAPATEEGSAAIPSTLEPGTALEGRVQKVERYGVFVWLGPGRVGLMPNVWSGERRGADMTRSFPVGARVEVEVVEFSEDGRRIRLARKGHAPQEAPPEKSAPRRGERPAQRESRESPEPGSFGTNLGDALRAALGRRQG